ncbi:MAG TPA: hypothetical protein ENK19_10790 [Acidobacteria bacterium]|nr:hypothetical protein [Acidobacteriota bacterium]
MSRTKLLLVVCSLAIALGASSGEPPPLNDPFLDALSGRWTLRGTVMGKPVVNEIEARWVLGHRFLELHLTDTASPPQYEALIFLGREAKTGRYIAHWLDVAGAGPSKVLGSGTRSGDTLVLSFPYPGATFRDTFTLDRKTGTWTLLIESHPDGKPWSTFASYTATRCGAATGS